MVSSAVAEIEQAFGTKRLGPGAPIFSGYAIDSRTVREGDLFFALAGERHDAHDYLPRALQRAAGAVVSRMSDETPGKPLFKVADTLTALQDLARHIRGRELFKVVGITGSAGKTTTKECLAVLLATRFRVAKNIGNLNNHIGLPLSLANVPDGTEVAVLEMGMNHAGEIAHMARICRPHIGILTNVKPVHLEFFDSLDGIAAAKSELLEGLVEGACLIVNAADPQLARIAARWPGKVVRFGFEYGGLHLPAHPELVEGNSSNVFARDWRSLGFDGASFTLVADAGEAAVKLPLVGRPASENFLAAAAAALELGLTPAEIAAAAAGLTPAAGRGSREVLANGATLVDESYNSNPAALAASLRTFADLPWEGRKIAILGDMLELGGEAPAFHRQAGADAAAAGLGFLVAIGPLAEEMAAAARAAGLAATRAFASSDAAADFVSTLVAPGDLVFAKGSRGIAVERSFESLRQVPRSAAAEGIH